jgi:hypothetical protein
MFEAMFIEATWAIIGGHIRKNGNDGGSISGDIIM